MLSYRQGNVLQEPNVANPVNMVGVMGAGLALQIARRWPACVEPYRSACRSKRLGDGSVFAWHHGRGWVFHTPTKRHWREKSSYELVDSSLAALVREAEAVRVSVVGLPMLGCGLGGLDATRVIELMIKHCGPSRVDFRLYGKQRPEPDAARKRAPAKRTRRPGADHTGGGAPKPKAARTSAAQRR